MSDADRLGPERLEAEPSWEEKVLKLNQAFAEQGIPYAFGGAIALNYHREPRSTLDIDINVFLPPDGRGDVLAVLSSLYTADEERITSDLAQQGQTRSLWGSTFVDLFFTNTEFHESMAERVSYEPFGEAQLPVISAEDLLVCKVLYDRPKDWLDIEAVAGTRGNALDKDYVRRWVGEFLTEDDPRLARLNSLVS